MALSDLIVWISIIVILVISIFLLVFWILQMIHAGKKAKWGWFISMLIAGLLVYPIGILLSFIYWIGRRK